VLLESTAAIHQDKREPIPQKVLKVETLIRPGDISCRNLFKVSEDVAKVPQMCPTPCILSLGWILLTIVELEYRLKFQPCLHSTSPQPSAPASCVHGVVRTIAASYVNVNRELSRIVGCCWSPQQPFIRTNVSQYHKKC
jgi:hypothetical protein